MNSINEEPTKEGLVEPDKEGFVSRNLMNIVLVIAVFLLGFITMAWPYWQSSTELGETQEQLLKTEGFLRKAEIGNQLMMAIIDGEEGDYDNALTSATSFFSNLREEIEKGDASAFGSSEKILLKQIIEKRDAVLGEIAVKNESGVKGLLAINSFYRRVLGLDLGKKPAVQSTPDSNSNQNQSEANGVNSNQANSNSPEDARPEQTDGNAANAENGNSSSNSNLSKDKANSNTKAGSF